MNKENLATFQRRQKAGLLVRNSRGGSAPDTDAVFRLGYRFRILTPAGELAQRPVWAAA